MTHIKQILMSAKSFVCGLALAGSMFVSTNAHAALSCTEIINMVSVNVPSQIIVQTMEGSGTQFTSADVQCLSEGGASADIVTAARGMMASAAPVAAPAAAPVAPTSAFDSAETLGDSLPVGEVATETSSGCSQLDNLIKAYRAKKVLTASYGFYDIMESGVCPDDTTKLNYYMAKALFDLKMYHSSQSYFMQVVRKGPRDPYFKYALPKLVAIAKLTGNDSELLRIVHKIPPEAFPRQAKNHLYYLMGRKYYEAGKLSEGAQYFAQISEKSDLYLKAKYFEGVIHTERSKYRSAVTAFQSVYEAEVTPRDDEDLMRVNRLKDLAIMNIARIYFELDKFEQADQFYGQVDRKSDYWATSVFERAYTNFWRNDLNTSLGLLLTTNSPYYANNTFIPEATILRGLAFFQMCKFDDVNNVLLGFEQTYRPMHAEIKAFLSQYSSTEAKKLTDEAYEAYFESKGKSTLSTSLFARILENADLSALVGHMDMMDEEIAAIEKQKVQWRDRLGVELVKSIEKDRLRYKKYAGAKLLQELSQIHRMLGDLMTQSEIIRFEVVDAQRAGYEYRMQNPEVDSSADKKVDFAVSKTIIYWPFNGEFWKDELGYYQYAEQSSCN
jgi:tetratricopeptide (TPR) repeat protein